jgi:holo-[acyl-carrier protein] synthase
VPFPFVVTMILSIGIDLVEVERIEQAAGRLGRRFLERVFTPAEIAYCEPRGARFVHYAGRFAAKEAAMKALGTGWAEGVAWREVEILPSAAGPPQLSLSGVALERFAALGASRAHLSISHTRTLAIAQVVFEGEGEAG